MRRRDIRCDVMPCRAMPCAILGRALRRVRRTGRSDARDLPARAFPTRSPPLPRELANTPRSAAKPSCPYLDFPRETYARLTWIVVTCPRLTVV
ncbi:hypothetical protein CGRA01v4_10435 [Colletotrichum graminicola]|nr:hypothetical protein CGRA01v4_10435 [Colletotrichum graminicola]